MGEVSLRSYLREYQKKKGKTKYATSKIDFNESSDYWMSQNDQRKNFSNDY